ncbi:helix-turn-helix domain-containing protein [Hymenobacter sp. BT770]|uniref:helix-turn-helix domain-containing protein n=1 Tax=Hymenobacter sp. BT770 TaxID=2886942 RepID=UPI00293E9A62|nr:helix-turn-helix domain-containing protein [Hymenobacter sp. BT770]
MVWQEFTPLASLRNIVECYWAYEDPNPAAPRQHAVLPSPKPSIIVVLGKHDEPVAFESTNGQRITESWMLGQVTDHRLSLRCARPAGLFGIMFQPTGFYQLLGISMAAAASMAPEQACAPRQFGEALTSRVQAAATHAERVAAAEDLLLAQPMRPTPGTPVVEVVAAALRQRRGQVYADELAHLAHLSRRQLERRFREAVGVSPKLFAEISRFARVFELLKEQPQTNWHDLAQACGYFDQAHFIREFRRFTEETPAAFFQHGRDADPLFWSG